MREKCYFAGRWFFDRRLGAWRFVRAGYYDVDTIDLPEEAYKHTIDDHEIEMLIKALDENGWIKPRLDERLRAEDLKITHRLINIIEKKL